MLLRFLAILSLVAALFASDKGVLIDPNGGTASLDAGSSMDPNGGGADTDSRGTMDPDGGGAMDPNG